MEFRVLGPVELAAEGRRLPLGSAHQRRLLAVLLAARGEVVSTDRLVDAVWGTRPPPSARKSLHSHVSRLRRALSAEPDGGRDALETVLDGYRLDLEEHMLDADRFEAEVGEARATLRRSPRQAVRHLDAALGLWRGPAYGELADHPVIRPDAVRLDELRAAATADRVDARLSLGGPRAVIGDLEASVAADPLAERPTGQLMRALYLAGRQAEALAAYRRLQQHLVEELGIDPSPELQRLHERILRQDAGLAATPEGSSPPVALALPNAGAPTHEEEAVELVGREEDVPAVSSLVTTTRVATLTGPGGVGKSVLARAVSRAVAGQFADGVVWCGFAGVRDPVSVPAALMAALVVQPQGDRPSTETLLSALGTRRLLLVLDGCEHLLEGVTELVDRIRAQCPQVTVLATSREYLRLPGERVWEVAPLSVPPATADADEVAASASGRLLWVRAQAVEPSFTLTDENARTIAALCRRLDGMPLALELAAARLRALSPEALAARLDQRFELLTGGSHGEGGRHRTLQAVVDWSYGLLTGSEAQLFDRLAVFAGAFTLHAAESLGAAEHPGVAEPLERRAVAGLLGELVDKSLVVVERLGGQVRYRLLDTLRAYGQRRLEAAGTLAGLRDAHADYHVQLVEELAPRLRGADEQAALADLDAAIDDLRTAQAWMLARETTDGALRLPGALHDELVFRPREEVFAWAERALELEGAAAQWAYPAALVTAARGALNRGELGTTRRLAEAALTVLASDDPVALGARYGLTTVALYEGRLDEAIRHAEARRELADTLEQPYHRALAGVSRALALRYRGDDAPAVTAVAEARRDAEASGNHTARAWALYSAGEALLDRDPEQAAALLEQAIDAARRVDRRFIEGVALVSLASVQGRLGHTDRGLELFRETVAHWRSLGVHTQQLTTLRNLVELLVRVGADESAAVLHGAVTAGVTPSFGLEAERLEQARRELEARLGQEVADTAAERGRRMQPTEVVDHALAELEGLLAAASGR
jgi:predicted ATPase/DNA-binding SARP family transcriptional activator